jgi:hypothetical protein
VNSSPSARLVVDVARAAAGQATGALDDACAELSELLWAERRLLDALLSSGDGVAAAVQHALEGLELLRAIRAESLADQLDLPAEATLRTLAGRLADPWQWILCDHRTALLHAAGMLDVSTGRRSLDDFLA